MKRWIGSVTLVLGVVACSSSDPSDDNVGSDDSAISVGDAVCGATAKSGFYCGGDKVSKGNSDVLYKCDGPGKPASAKKCADGCSVNSGRDDSCKVSYHLPWTKGTTMHLTQDCDDSCCSDHVGSDEYAYDWANGSSFVVRAARGGTISHLKINSTKGCATTACSVDVNMLVIDHGDGTQAIYMHLKGDSEFPGITCGAHVEQGQALAMSGTTGHSTGVHLHFQVSQKHPSAPTCECGASGKACATTYNPFPDTWVNDGFHTVPVTFEEWPTSAQCNNRRITMPESLSE